LPISLPELDAVLTADLTADLTAGFFFLLKRIFVVFYCTNIAVKVMSWFGQHRVRLGWCTHVGDVIDLLVLARRLSVVDGGCNYIYRLMIEVNVDVVGSMMKDLKVGEFGSRFQRSCLRNIKFVREHVWLVLCSSDSCNVQIDRNVVMGLSLSPL
jgi:hypothetical protein